MGSYTCVQIPNIVGNISFEPRTTPDDAETDFRQSKGLRIWPYERGDDHNDCVCFYDDHSVHGDHEYDRLYYLATITTITTTTTAASYNSTTSATSGGSRVTTMISATASATADECKPHKRLTAATTCTIRSTNVGTYTITTTTTILRMATMSTSGLMFSASCDDDNEYVAQDVY